MFDIFRFLKKQKNNEEGLSEIISLKNELKRLDSDINSVFSFMNQIGSSVGDLQDKITEIFGVTRLSLQNHDELKGQASRLQSIEDTLTQLANSHNHMREELIKKLSFIHSSMQPKTQIQQSAQQFSDTSLNSVNSSVKSKVVETEVTTQIPQPQIAKTGLEGLTMMEKRTFATLAGLVKESVEKEASYENLVRELYPNMPLIKRRSTVSNFLRKLEIQGLIRRERRGRHKVVIFTPTGLGAINEENLKILQKNLLK